MAGDRLVRLVHSDPTLGSVAELLVYDRRGIERYYRIDGVSDTHAVVWDGRHFVISSTGDTSILWIDRAGDIVRTWRPTDPVNAWNVNSLTLHEGRLIASAFGRFHRYREWAARKENPTGIVFDVETGEDLVVGLSMPHDPRYVDGTWLVCNSREGELVQAAPESRQITRRLELRHFTRGLAISDDYLFVGESALRHESSGSASSSIAIVSRRSWDLVSRVSLPCREIHDLTLVPRALLEGVRTGFRTNPDRTLQHDRQELFWRLGVTPARLWAAGVPLPPEACRVRITAEAPEELEADSVTSVDVQFVNISAMVFIPSPRFPIALSYRWLDPATGELIQEVDGIRTPLGEPLLPGRMHSSSVTVLAPSTPGKYLLRITLVQEYVAWFDEIDAGNASSHRVRVRTSTDR